MVSTLRQPCTESPFASSRCYLFEDSIICYLSQYYSALFATAGSCARPSSSPALCQWLVTRVFAGCCMSLLENGPSRRYLCGSFTGCLDPYPGGFLCCICPFLHIETSAFPPFEQGRLSHNTPHSNFSVGVYFGAAVIH